MVKLIVQVLTSGQCHFDQRSYFSNTKCQVSILRTNGPLVGSAVRFGHPLVEPHCEKTGFLPMRKQRRRSASQ